MRKANVVKSKHLPFKKATNGMSIERNTKLFFYYDLKLRNNVPNVNFF